MIAKNRIDSFLIQYKEREKEMQEEYEKAPDTGKEDYNKDYYRAVLKVIANTLADFTGWTEIEATEQEKDNLAWALINKYQADYNRVNKNWSGESDRGKLNQLSVIINDLKRCEDLESGDYSAYVVGMIQAEGGGGLMISNNVDVLMEQFVGAIAVFETPGATSEKMKELYTAAGNEIGAEAGTLLKWMRANYKFIKQKGEFWSDKKEKV